MADAESTPPVTVGEEIQPQDPNLLGSLSPSDLATMTSLRQQMLQLQVRIGDIEIQKARHIGAVAQLEQQMDTLLSTVGQQLGVPDGERFHVGPDGRCWRTPRM